MSLRALLVGAGITGTCFLLMAQVAIEGSDLFIGPPPPGLVVYGATAPQVVVKGTTTTDVTFTVPFSVKPVCTCSYSASGFDPGADLLICVPSTTGIDVDVTGGTDPPVEASYLCVGDQ